jgi:hypothetical protein
MVISYDHEHRNARLSLRQNEILEELANDEKLKRAGGAVPGLQVTVRYSCEGVDVVPRKIFLLFIPNMDDICLKRRLGNHMVMISRISLKLKRICEDGTHH